MKITIIFMFWSHFTTFGAANQDIQIFKTKLEGIGKYLLSEYKAYIDLVQSRAIATLKGPKIFTSKKAELINCDVTVPKIKRACLQKAQNIPIKAIGRGLYYTSDDIQLNWWDSMKWCRSRGLVLSSIETGWKERELTDLLTDIGTFSTYEGTITLWTSGNNFGTVKDQFYWFNSNRTFTSVGGSKTNRCVQLSLNRTSQKLSLEGANCGLTRGFVCDVPRHCYASVCYGTSGTKKNKPKPPVTASCPKEIMPVQCWKKDELFDSDDGNIMEEKAEGVQLYACGKKIFISTSLATYMESRRKCCEVGMAMINVETQAKLECFTEQLFRVYPQYTATFWIDAYTTTCTNGQFIPFTWCTVKRQFALMGVPWLAGEPFCKFGVENCARWYVTPRTSGLGIELCDNQYEGALTLCESDVSANETIVKSSSREIIRALTKAGGKKIFPNVMMYPANVIKDYKKFPTCEKMKECAIDKKKKPDLSSAKASNIGSTFEACGKTYITSKKTIPYIKAWEFCCSFGMVLSTFESRQQMDCVVENLREDNRTSKIYFIASHDENVDRKFLWCRINTSKNNSIDPRLWCPEEPSNYKQVENVLVLVVMPAASGCIGDGGSTFPQYILCEDPTKETVLPVEIKFPSLSTTTSSPQTCSTTYISSPPISTSTNEGTTSPQLTNDSTFYQNTNNENSLERKTTNEN